MILQHSQRGLNTASFEIDLVIILSKWDFVSCIYKFFILFAKILCNKLIYDIISHIFEESKYYENHKIFFNK